MLFMTVFTFEPEQRDAILKRRREGPFHVEGTKYLGEWSALAGGKVFRLVETDDVRALIAGAHPWTDLGKLEFIPVISGDDLLKVLSTQR